MIQIQIWGDFECPYTYYQVLVLSKLKKQYSSNIDILWRAPKLPIKKGSSVPDQSYIDNFQTAALDSIVDENQLKMRIPKLLRDTWLIQECALYANTLDKTLPFTTKIFEALFKKGTDISLEIEILKIAEKVGLNPEILRGILNTGTYTKQTILDANEYQTYGFQGIPAMLIGEKNFSPRSFSPITGYKTFEQLLKLIPISSLNGGGNLESN
ncbi:DsbA family protein [Polynucleobacter antarcticus]|uniref:DSBA-like thioredoxin domain-containing protein n=1 Tax=Polynucleobacter antarcticus TaxID=1743162 RepID=A0A6M9PQI5_9BURK|nr:DsbA family protein [Polynucleobacter antarcticus]QKM62142.1 hypothetical protein DCO16_03040 [Polynucleobacter antarcticus]